MKWLSRLALNQKLALGAGILGAVALFARPVPGPVVRIDPRELAIVAQRGADQVSPLELADWIVQGRSDYRLLDLRDARAFAAYHVPTSENVPLPTLADASIGANDVVVLYAEDAVKSAQAWFLLRAKGYRGIYMLRGAIEGWKEQVLYPAVKDGTPPEQAAKLRALSAHFGGAVRLAATAAATEAAPAQTAMQVVPPPPPAPVKAAAPAKVKKKEGC